MYYLDRKLNFMIIFVSPKHNTSILYLCTHTTTRILLLLLVHMKNIRFESRLWKKCSLSSSSAFSTRANVISSFTRQSQGNVIKGQYEKALHHYFTDDFASHDLGLPGDCKVHYN